MDDIKQLHYFYYKKLPNAQISHCDKKKKKPYLLPHGFVFYYVYLRTQNSHGIQKYLVPNLPSVKGACYCFCCYLL